MRHSFETLLTLKILSDFGVGKHGNTPNQQVGIHKESAHLRIPYLGKLVVEGFDAHQWEKLVLVGRSSKPRIFKSYGEGWTWKFSKLGISSGPIPWGFCVAGHEFFKSSRKDGVESSRIWWLNLTLVCFVIFKCMCNLEWGPSYCLNICTRSKTYFTWSTTTNYTSKCINLLFFQREMIWRGPSMAGCGSKNFHTKSNCYDVAHKQMVVNIA